MGLLERRLLEKVTLGAAVLVLVTTACSRDGKSGDVVAPDETPPLPVPTRIPNPTPVGRLTSYGEDDCSHLSMYEYEPMGMTFSVNFGDLSLQVHDTTGAPPYYSRYAIGIRENGILLWERDGQGRYIDAKRYPLPGEDEKMSFVFVYYLNGSFEEENFQIDEYVVASCDDGNGEPAIRFWVHNRNKDGLVPYDIEKLWNLV